MTEPFEGYVADEAAQQQMFPVGWKIAWEESEGQEVVAVVQSNGSDYVTVIWPESGMTRSVPRSGIKRVIKPKPPIPPLGPLPEQLRGAVRDLREILAYCDDRGVDDVIEDLLTGVIGVVEKAALVLTANLRDAK